jgi:hypothetical protein
MVNRPNTFRFAALCIVLTSCAVPKSGAVDEIDSSDIPFELNSPDTSAPATTTSVVLTSPITGSSFEQADLYFVDGSSLERVRLEIPSPTDLQGVFTALIAGLPDPAHTKVKTLLPVDFAAVIEVEGGVANVNAKRVYLDSIKPNEQRLAIAQIVLTLTSQPGIGQVTFSVGGKAIGVPRGRGDIAGAGTPVTFDDYKMLIAK